MKNKIKILVLLLISFAVVQVRGQTCTITGSSTIKVNQTKTYSISSVTGASQFWSVTGGLTIVRVKHRNRRISERCVNRIGSTLRFTI